MSAEVTKHHLLGYLQPHIGAAKGISAQALADLAGCNKRQVRSLVTELRMAGTAVCGHPSTGYFIAENDAELEQTLRYLRDRAMTSLILESKLRKMALPDLLGQLRVPT